jgi:formylglycine-generating enzyme
MRWFLLFGTLIFNFSQLSAQTELGNRYAILAGSEYYEHSKFASLEYSEDDVLALSELLIKANYKVSLLCDSAGKIDSNQLPTKSNIEKAFNAVLASLKRNDTILIFLTGHGQQTVGETDSYYCPRDAHPTDKNKLISLKKIYDDLDNCGAGLKVLMVDACRNDPDPGRGRSSGIDAHTAPSPPRGLAAFFSCSGGERSFEHKEIKHGVFTYQILRGLQGDAADKDGDVTFEGLVSHVKKNSVKTIAQLKLQSKQSPEMNAQGLSGDTVLINSQDMLAIQKHFSIASSEIKNTPILPQFNRSKTEIPAPPAITPPPAVSPNQEMPANRFTKNSLEPPAPPEPEAKQPQAGTLWDTNSLAMKFIYVPAGEYLMGAPESDLAVFTSQAQQAPVKISQGFYMGKFEVTQQEWKSVMGTEPWKGKDDAKAGDNFPASCIGWEDASAFCKKLQTTMPFQNMEFRLPTEAEWEYACRAGTTTQFHFGQEDKVIDQFGWTNRSPQVAAAQHAQPVGVKKPNPWGLHDMHGNVCEWCSDWYELIIRGGVDPKGPEAGDMRVTRGGSWRNEPLDCASYYRRRDGIDNRFGNIGFRVVLAPVKK